MSVSPKKNPPTMARWVLILIGGGCVAACSFILNFDPNGQPCSTDPSARCLTGYYCDSDAGVCRLGTQPAPNADAGACGGACAANQICLPYRNLCVDSATCRASPCAVGFECIVPDAGPRDAGTFDAGAFDAGSTDAGSADAGRIDYCQPVLSPLGSRCTSDSQCTVIGQICLVSSAYEITDAGPVLASGFCVIPCLANPNACPPGTTCIPVQPPSHASKPVSLCLLDVGPSTTDPLLLAPLQCQREEDCDDFPGLTCTVFDNAALPDAVSFCDSTIAGGVSGGAACHRMAVPLAANGICLPEGAARGEADALCSTSADCQVGNCLVCEYSTGARTATGAALLRGVGACYSKGPSLCLPCTTTADCSADAPHCLVGDGGTCLMACDTSGSCPTGHFCSDAGYCSCP